MQFSTSLLLFFCLLPLTLAQRSRTSCCVLSRAKLASLRGKTKSCPSSSFEVNLVDKCQKCPVGTCRVGYDCVCPDFFLGSGSYQRKCANSFEKAWPASVRKPDLDWRICRATPPPTIKATGKSCCAMNKQELDKIRGWSRKCPSSAFELNLVDKCQKCPVGTCRVGYDCVCPDFFLGSSSYQRKCANSFLKAWPASVGTQDRDWRICKATPPPTIKPSGRSCCALNKQALERIRGWSRQCPSSSFDMNLVDKCQKCPAGTCRVGYDCICPDFFLGSSSYQRMCEDSFEVSWPVSTRRIDLDWRSCTGTAPKAQRSLESCCRQTRVALMKLRGVNNQCPSSRTVLSMSSKCEKCPPGTCRVGYDCICPEYFLDSGFYQGECEDSFGKSWPVTIGRKDLDWRSCQKNAPKGSRSKKSCCRMTRVELTALRGLSNSCPSSSIVAHLSGKCGKCPQGTCRVSDRCLCPDNFLGSGFYQKECEEGFGVSWPVSTRKNDRDC